MRAFIEVMSSHRLETSHWRAECDENRTLRSVEGRGKRAMEVVPRLRPILLPWYSAHASLDVLLVGRRIGMMHLVCYLRDGDRVFETYWTTIRGVEAMDNSYALMDLTVYGRQEPWEDSPAGWPQRWETNDNGEQLRTNGRPIAQCSRLAAGRSDDLGTSATATDNNGSHNQP